MNLEEDLQGIVTLLRMSFGYVQVFIRRNLLDYIGASFLKTFKFKNTVATYPAFSFRQGVVESEMQERIVGMDAQDRRGDVDGAVKMECAAEKAGQEMGVTETWGSREKVMCAYSASAR